MLLTISYFILFGTIGVIIDFVFSSIKSKLTQDKNPALVKNKYLWMFPAYGVITFFIPFYDYLVNLGVPMTLRLLVYLVILYAIELLYGSLIKKITKGYVWYYDGKYKLFHLINFLYAPFWIVFLYFVEKIVDLIR